MKEPYSAGAAAVGLRLRQQPKGLTISAILSLVVVSSAYRASISCESEWIVWISYSTHLINSAVDKSACWDRW